MGGRRRGGRERLLVHGVMSVQRSENQGQFSSSSLFKARSLLFLPGSPPVSKRFLCLRLPSSLGMLGCLLVYLLIWDRVSLGSSCWSWIHSIDQTGLWTHYNPPTLLPERWDQRGAPLHRDFRCCSQHRIKLKAYQWMGGRSSGALHTPRVASSHQRMKACRLWEHRVNWKTLCLVKWARPGTIICMLSLECYNVSAKNQVLKNK